MILKVSELIRNIANELVKSCKTEHESNQEAWWILEEITQKKELILLLEEILNHLNSELCLQKKTQENSL